MIRLKPALTEEEVKKTGVAEIRKKYNELAQDYNKILDGKLYYCHSCNEFHNADQFYSDKKYASGLYPICKRCLIKMACDYDKKSNQYIDNREKTMEVLKMMDLPYIDSMYKSAITSTSEDVNDKHRNTAWSHYITVIKSLPQWRGKNWKDSEFGVDDDTSELSGVMSNKKPRKEIVRLFGSGFSNEDYLYLQDQYDDWRSRTQVDSKSQETYIVRICFKLLDIWKAQRNGKDTKDLDKSLNDLMAAANLQPKQNVANAANDTLTFGQLIEKWENEKPIPEPEDEFKDCDKISQYLRIWFSGHLARALGLDNGYSREYDEYISRYKVNKAEAQEEGSSSDIYNKLFGTLEGGDD